MSITSSLKPCTYCSEKIPYLAVRCKHCGEFQEDDPLPSFIMPAPVKNHSLPHREWSPALAAILSFLIPGLGQMYKGNVATGFIWMVVTGIGYVLFLVPGAIFHMACIISAAWGDNY
ncbi:MAG: hypothetical protein ABWZ25_11255 [Chitinophagaceae bacterium]